MRVLVLGRNGMLGRYVYSYLAEHFEIIGTTRGELNATDINIAFVASNIKLGDVVINCIGIIKQRDDSKRIDFVAVNSMFPLIVQEACVSKGAKLIQISTDCVYNGIDGNYNEYSIPNATDIYGRTKSLGEPEDATIIRTSIIGEELNNKRSLLEWVKSNRDKEVTGYTNHAWNGITCLQFAKICKQIIDDKLFWRGTKHIYSPEAITKYNLVKLISKIYDLNLKVVPYETETICDRTLTSIRNDIKINVPELEIQIDEMKLFYNILKGGQTYK